MNFKTAFLTVILLCTTSLCFSDSALISQCANYLSYSDSQFDSLLTSSKNTANNISFILNSCVLENACSDLNIGDQCPSLLATRTFLSNYFANKDTNNGNGTTLTMLPSKKLLLLPPEENSTNSQSTTLVNSSQPSSEREKKVSSIHWF